MSLPCFDLDGRVALVTGACGGIGAAVATTLAEAGADVALVDRASERFEEIADRIARLGRRSASIVADVSDSDDVAAAVERAEAELGPVRHAVNCAGINFGVPALEMTRAQFDELIDVNLGGVFASCQAEGRAMVASGAGGSIVNIGSISASIANRGLTQVHYNSAKAGVVHLTSSLALEWAPLGIRVNAVSPGYTRTPMATHPDVWEHVKAYAKDIPLQRWAEPEEIARPVLFLLSDAASYCTGSNLIVDGGSVYW
jgi:NAD(P)-dependent dehydrogenase (short-subunit alcohol dehydrogenase family)